MTDDGPIPMDLVNVGAYDAKATQNDSDVTNDMSHEDVRARVWKGYKAGKGAGKKGPNGSGTWHRAGETTEARKEARAANLIDTATMTRDAVEAKGKARAKAKVGAKPDTATIAESKDISGRTVHTSGPTA